MAERLSEKLIFFEGKYEILREARKGFIYFITLPLIFISQLNRATAYFVNFSVLSGIAFVNSFLMTQSHYCKTQQNDFGFLPCKIGKLCADYASLSRKQSEDKYRCRRGLLCDNCLMSFHHVTKSNQ